MGKGVPNGGSGSRVELFQRYFESKRLRSKSLMSLN